MSTKRPRSRPSAAPAEKLPPKVHIKHGSYYLVGRRPNGSREWVKLSRVSAGPAAMYTRLGEVLTRPVEDDRMPNVIASWQKDVMARRAAKTQKDDIARCAIVAQALGQFRAEELRTPHFVEFLRNFLATPRTHNAYRALCSDLMRYAQVRGWRQDNPVTPIKTLSTPPRTRYITDAELKAIKDGVMIGEDGQQTRSGQMICALIDVAYLTGQDIGMLLELRWSEIPGETPTAVVREDGILFRRSKVEHSTGASVVIEYTPALTAVMDKLRTLRAEIKPKPVGNRVFTTQTGSPLSYWAAASAWRRGLARSGVKSAMFRDLRAKALTDKESRDGMRAASAMGAHSTESQTADYVRRIAPRRTSAAA